MRACTEGCKQEFKAKNFLLGHDNPQTFVQFQFGCQTIYLVWRIFWALYHVAWIIVSGVRADLWAGEDRTQYVKWFIFLTDWAYFMLTLSTLVDACVVIYVFVFRRDIRKGITDQLPWYLRAEWCLYNMGNVISVTTSIAYWSIVYNGSQPITSVDIATHLLNAIYVVINISVTGMPMRILHFWFSLLFGLVYSLFTLFYHFAGGTNHNGNPYVYPAINWRNPGKAVMYCVIVTFVAVPIVHLFLFGINCLKLYFYRRFRCCTRSSFSDDTELEIEQQSIGQNSEQGNKNKLSRSSSSSSSDDDILEIMKQNNKMQKDDH